ncbi:indolepyruvate oxidoreductase subunit beta family protein [Alisedimentitalea sp. MJ-SS2]|uniref:indolepyruvate oxidoreductase subunit beta family protein n=1 Tax=Aliisedimentitalea sp. MJ-SS2 TaxID=3049795 RepID=UPI00290C3F78|nr:indolepyruvate oxidoreductase subunit beta family protein [Alisedimentitalea sp. MJ-SS2]MDU8926729.1 indolepyruvate oxidoreductase subunit beta family protein [Alisedimentitalea sp. MJ-SS2]
MTLQGVLPDQGGDLSQGILKIAIMAVGGQGGGVLGGWVADLAMRGGYAVQSTSVAGVAQRTGATIYYIEMAPKAGVAPVFALSPSPGDVDVVVAAELMEAGRAVLRGFVTPDRTVLVASSHRILAVSEKIIPGDGRADQAPAHAALTAASRQLVIGDLEKVAQRAGSVISASLFGALARSGALPFPVEMFEEVIRASGRGVEASLAAFRGALTEEVETPLPETTAGERHVTGPEKLLQEWRALEARIAPWPGPVQEMARAGLEVCVDYLDLRYGGEYLDRVEVFVEKSEILAVAAAKYLARAMCYDDIPRVADLKTRASREQRVRREQEIDAGAVMHVTEYFHPRAEEVISILPRRFGAWVERTGWAKALIGRVFSKGRRVRSDRLGGFVMLWLVAGLGKRRRGMLRHAVEKAHADRLQDMARWAALEGDDPADTDEALAAEILACQRLIKGYSDTHARGLSKFERVIGALPMLERRADAADWLRRLREAALRDEKGEALDGAIATVKTFAERQDG